MNLQPHNKKGHPLTSKKQRNIRLLKGRCHEQTAKSWASDLGVSESTVRDYAVVLGEKFKSPPPPGRPKSDEFDCSLMVEWATRPIR